MQPNNTRHITVPSRKDDPTPPSQKPDRELAVALMREQINRLYAGDTSSASQTTAPQTEVLPSVTASSPAPETSQTTPQTTSTTPTSSPDDTHTSPYDRSHNNTQEYVMRSDQWRHYHTAWQQYYQQYYERYYLTQIQARERNSHMFPQTVQSSPPLSTEQTKKEEVISPEKATRGLKAELRQKIKQNSQKVRKSRHFIPALSAIMVMLVFLFLQYNRLVVAQVKSYVSPGAISPQNIILDASTNTKVGPEPRMIVPKINIDAPVVYGVESLAEATVQNALRNGIIHYPIPGANANPGEKGNSVFLGHSSNDVFDDGGYKFVFVQLEQMAVGDKFYINYNGTRYTYAVTRTETIMPTEIQKLITDNSKPTVTLVTCTPVGTAQKRFLVHADQTSPDPNGATQATQQPPATNQPSNISGNSPTLFDRLFGF